VICEIKIKYFNVTVAMVNNTAVWTEIMLRIMLYSINIYVRLLHKIGC